MKLVYENLFDLQVVILKVILYQWRTRTVMGTGLGVKSHGESILTIFMSHNITVNLETEVNPHGESILTIFMSLT